MHLGIIWLIHVVQTNPENNSRDVFLQKVDSDGLLVVPGEDALAVSLDHARFAHSSVSHNHHLKIL